MIRYSCPVCAYTYDLPERSNWGQVTCNCPDCLLRDVKIVKLVAVKLDAEKTYDPAAISAHVAAAARAEESIPYEELEEAADKLRANSPVIHVFETMASFSIPERARREVHEALNAHHGWTWVPTGPAPAELVDAAYRVCASYGLPVRVAIRGDGRFDVTCLPDTLHIDLVKDRDRLLEALKDLVARVPNDVYGWEGDVPNPLFNAARAAIAGR